MVLKRKEFKLKRKPKNNMGRPKKYTPEFIANEAIYFEEWVYQQMGKNLLWINEFAALRGYYPEKMSAFAKENADFDKVLKWAKKVQEIKIVKGGASGKLQQTFCMFLLKCKHGYNDGNYLKRVQLSGDKDNPIKEEKTIKLDFGTIDEAELKEIDKAVE